MGRKPVNNEFRKRLDDISERATEAFKRATEDTIRLLVSSAGDGKTADIVIIGHERRLSEIRLETEREMLKAAKENERELTAYLRKQLVYCIAMLLLAALAAIYAIIKHSS